MPDKPLDALSSENAPQPSAREEGRPPRKRWRLGLVTLFLVVAAILFFQYRGKRATTTQKPAAGPPPILISSVTARQGEIGVYVNALGLVTPVNTVAVRTRVDGQLLKVNYLEGQMVQRGNSLAEIDPAPFQAAVTQAEGQLARDTALLENARRDLQRYQDALARNAIPKQLYETQVATTHQYEGLVKLDQGQLDNAKIQLAYCHITAPITGRVGLRLVDPGNLVRASDSNALVVITQLQPITVLCSVAEDYLPQIQQQLQRGKQITVTALDRTQQRQLATGVLQTLDNQIDPSTGTIKLKSLFTNEEGPLFPNQFVNVRLLLDLHHNAILLPNSVIQHNAQGAYVYRLNPDRTVKVHPVTVVTTDGNLSEVNGVEVGAVVAADNFNRLTDGARVMLRPTTGKGAP